MRARCRSYGSCSIAVQASAVARARALTFGPTKTGRNRIIDIDENTAALLAKHRRAQAELKMANRTTYREHGLVFAKEWADVRGHKDSLGQPLQMNTFGQREYARLIKAACVKPIKFHGLRHTCATLLLAAGEPVYVVSERLGHASATMTLDVYGHVVGNMQRRAAATVGGCCTVAFKKARRADVRDLWMS